MAVCPEQCPAGQQVEAVCEGRGGGKGGVVVGRGRVGWVGDGGHKTQSTILFVHVAFGG